MIILGIAAYYHDSSAAVVVDGEVMACAQEEWFTRLKHDPSFPHQAVEWCLQQSGYRISEVDAIAFYDKPFLKFERLLTTYYNTAPTGGKSFVKSIPIWIKEKLFLKSKIRKELKLLFPKEDIPKLLFPEHHLSHAASAYYPSPFEESAVLTIDGVGEWATASIGYGSGDELVMHKELKFPHSVGLLYSAFTYFLGFRVNFGEYKLMGLAPYGQANHPQTQTFIEKIKSDLIEIFPDGSIWLDQSYFTYSTSDRMIKEGKWASLFGIPRRLPESEFEQVHCNMALAIQRVTEEIVILMAKEAQRLTGSKNLCLAGGVALNCVANGVLSREKIFEKIWIQPASGDAGGSLGAALAADQIYFKTPRFRSAQKQDEMKGAFLGPYFSDKEVLEVARYNKAVFQHFSDSELYDHVATYISEGNVIGWYQGRQEFGPRALGNRSILGDPRSPEMQSKINLKIKFRESFRPFAPSVLDQEASKYFNLEGESPYMLLVAPVQNDIRHVVPDHYDSMELLEKLHVQRSDLPAITHVDYSARVQTVHEETNPRYHKLIDAFKEKTGVGVLINTSFNVRGEPVVCTPKDAYRCFMKTDMDILVMNNYVFKKTDQNNEALSLELSQEKYELD